MAFLAVDGSPKGCSSAGHVEVLELRPFRNILRRSLLYCVMLEP